MKQLSMLFIALFALGGSLCAADAKIGFVNFKECVEKSKLGVQERNAFEALQTQMGESLEKTDKELAELATKLQDQDYMDGLSPNAEAELKERYARLNQEFSQYQNQYYQMLNQANFKLVQSLHEKVSLAAEKVREGKNFSLILNEESTFAFSNSLDVTEHVIAEMDKRYEIENSEHLVNLQKAGNE